MTIRTLLKFRNLDLTKDINDQFGFVTAGVFEGGEVTPVVAQLKVDLVAPWALITKEGMVVEETADSTRLDTPAGQVTIIAVRAVYVDNNDPIVSVEAIEESAFALLTNQDEYIIFAKVDVPLAATSILTSYVKLDDRNIVDKVGRNQIRGLVTDASLLPAAENNKDGDLYVVTAGGGGVIHIYGWDGVTWILMTDAVSVTNDLATHRANLFTDEKHLTDDEKNAVVGTSGTAPSASNPFIDNADTRIPTQDENDALEGSDGSPSSSNRYVTEEFPLAVPEEKTIASAPTGSSIEVVAIEGPFYVGKLSTGSANDHFKFYDSTEQREYTTSTGSIVNVSGVFTDSGLTSELDPSINPNVDADGFFSGASLYVAFDVTPDTGLKLVYGKKRTFGAFPVDSLLRRTVNDAQASADVITKIEAIKGRDFDDTPPTNEQNIELRKDVVDLKEYNSAVFKADHVIGEFSRVENVPDFNNDFVTNIGIPANYSFENTGLEGFNYNNSTATVTYNNPVAIGSVVPGQVFIDGNEDEYEITSVPDLQSVVIQKRNGVTPLSINTSNTTSVHGSIKPDNNPRKINLSTFEYIIGRERISCREIEPVLDEFHPSNNNIAFQIRTPLHSAFFREPRVRFYGGFQNVESGTRARVVCTNTGFMLITGFFTDVRLLVDLMSASPTITVKINGDPVGTAIDLSRSGTVATLGTVNDIQQEGITIASGLADLVPHTIEIDIANGTDEFIIHGIDLYRTATSTVAVLPGRAFVQTDLVKSDAIVSFASYATTLRSRGAITSRYINRSESQQTQSSQLVDYDGAAAGPAGTAVSGTPNFTVSSGLTKFQNYKAGDIVKLVGATDEEVKQIDSIPSVGQIVFSDNVNLSGAVILLHMASTVGDSQDPIEEFNRYLISELGTRQDSDFSNLFFIPSDRIFTVEDGTTSIAGNDVQYVTTGIDGVDTALQLVGAGSSVRIRAVASQMDLIVANSTGTTADFAIDGSPTYNVAIPGVGLSKITAWTNARYQTHELIITNATGMNIAGIILHAPKFAPPIEGTLLSTQLIVADYSTSLTTDGSVMPIGIAAVDPFKMGGVFVNGSGIGTDWTNTISFAENPDWGRFLQTDKEGSYFEYYFLDSGFEIEYQAKNDRGRPQVFLNGVLATSVNFPGATFTGMDSSTGEVDMYNSSTTPVRTKFGISGLTYASYLLRIEVQTPRENNVSSIGFFINIGTFYEVNDSGRFSVTPSRGFRGKTGTDDFVYGLDWARDDRNFDSGAVAREEVPVFRTIIQETRSQQVSLLSGSTSIGVGFSTAFEDADYSLTVTMQNTVDSSPEFRPVVITSHTAAGFTASWNDPLESNNYVLNYTAIKFV